MKLKLEKLNQCRTVCCCVYNAEVVVEVEVRFRKLVVLLIDFSDVEVEYFECVVAEVEVEIEVGKTEYFLSVCFCVNKPEVEVEVRFKKLIVLLIDSLSNVEVE